MAKKNAPINLNITPAQFDAAVENQKAELREIFADPLFQKLGSDLLGIDLMKEVTKKSWQEIGTKQKPK